MHRGIVQSLSICIWLLYAYGDLVTRSPYATICISGPLLISVWIWGSIPKKSKKIAHDNPHLQKVFVSIRGLIETLDAINVIFLRGNLNFVDKPKLLWVLLRLQITRAPPWCFPPIIQSCLPPWLRPPINNPSTVKLPLSIQWTPTAQCCLPGGNSSLLAPFPPPCYLLGMRCLSLYVLVIVCPVVGISHHLSPKCKYTGWSRLSPTTQQQRQQQHRWRQCRQQAMQTTTQTSTQTTTMPHRWWTSMLTTDNNANNNTTTQTTGDGADKDDTTADVDATSKTLRWHNNQPGKWHGRPLRNEVAVAVAMDVDRARMRAGMVLTVARAVAVARVVVVAVAVAVVVAVVVALAVRLVARLVARSVARMVARLVTRLVARFVAKLVVKSVAKLVASMVARLVVRLVAAAVARTIAVARSVGRTVARRWRWRGWWWGWWQGWWWGWWQSWWQG